MIKSLFSNWGIKGRGLRGALFGSTGLGTRAGLAAGYLGTSLGASAYIQHVADMKKAYYGESRYNSYYGSGADSLSGLVTGVGIWFGGSALLGRDLVGRTRGEMKYWKQGRPIIDRNRNIIRKLRRDHPAKNGVEYNDYRVQAAKGRIMEAKATPRWTSPGGLAFLTTAAAMSPVMPNRDPLLVAGVAGGAMAVTAGIALGYGYKKAGATVGGFMGAMGATAVGGYAGYKVATRNRTPAAEGDITGFGYNSPTAKMNWSTAGLVQALHNMNRKVM